MGSDQTHHDPIRAHRRSRYHPVRWLLLSGSRRSLTLLLSIAVLVALLGVGTLWEIEMEALVNETRAVQSILNTLLGGIILFVSVVLSINTAALSQEFAPFRTKRVTMQEHLEFQAELEAFVDEGTSPTDIHGFFRFVLRALRTEAGAVRDQAAALETTPARRELETFVEGLDAELATVEKELDTGTRSMSSTLLAGLDWESAHHIYLARHLQSEFGEELPRATATSLSTLVELLTTFTSGREYFTTLYFKEELRRMSSSLLVLSLPVIVFTAYVLLAIDAGLFPTLTFWGIQHRLLYVSIAFVIALSPYMLLSAYMLRIVTVSKHSLGAGGFTVTAVEAE